MSSSNQNVTIRLLGKEYAIACPEGAEQQLRDAASLLDGKMQDIQSASKVMGMERIAVMAALNISHEFLTQKAQQAERMEDRMKRLGEKIDKSLANR